MDTVRDFLMPDLGEGLTEGEIVAWLVAVGDTVDVDQPVVEMSTEKATVAVPIPFAGRVAALHGAAGDVVRVGGPLISVAVADGPEGSGRVLVGYGTGAGRARRRRVGTGGAAAAATPGAGVATGSAPAPPPERVAPARAVPVPSSPLVRRLAAELGVDLAAVAGSGPLGSVTRADLERHAAGSAPADPAPEIPAPAGRAPLRGVRRLTAERLAASHRDVPAAAAWVAVDAGRLLAWRDRLAARAPEAGVTPLALVLALCATALRRFPLLNASYDAASAEVVGHDAVHLGVATQTDAGLVVPVIRDADRRAALDLARELRRLAAAAREGRLAAAEMRGSTFTVSNYGAFGVDGGVAIINPPEAAILGVGRIADRAWVVDGAVAVRPVLELTLAFDHRVCDGRDAGGFLRALGDAVEDPLVALSER